VRSCIYFDMARNKQGTPLECRKKLSRNKKQQPAFLFTNVTYNSVTYSGQRARGRKPIHCGSRPIFDQNVCLKTLFLTDNFKNKVTNNLRLLSICTTWKISRSTEKMLLPLMKHPSAATVTFIPNYSFWIILHHDYTYPGHCWPLFACTKQCIMFSYIKCVC